MSMPTVLTKPLQRLTDGLADATRRVALGVRRAGLTRLNTPYRLNAHRLTAHRGGTQLAALALATVAGQAVGNPVRYAYIELPIQPATSATAVAINENGQAVGEGLLPDGRQVAILWTLDSVDGLPTATQIGLRAEGSTVPTCLTDTGVISGWLGSRDSELAFVTSGFILGPIPPAARGTTARAVNNSGKVVGSAGKDFGAWGVRFVNGIMERLPVPTTASGSIAYSINVSGVVAGSIMIGSGWRPALWDGDQYQLLDATGSMVGQALSISDGGQVVGYIRPNGGTPRAFTWDGGDPFPLPTLGTGEAVAQAVNNPGLIVGWARVGQGFADPSLTVGDLRAVAWSNGTLVDLARRCVNLKPGVRLVQALAVNDRGEIVGRARGITGVEWPFLLRPIACESDMDADGLVRSSDLNLFVTTFFEGLSRPTVWSHPADFDGDGVVRSADLTLFLNAWLGEIANGC